MPVRPRLLLFLAVLAAAAALLPGVAAGGSTEDNRAAATSEADALMAAVALPADVVALDGEPAGDNGLLASPPTQGANPNTVVRTAFFRTAVSPADVLALTDAHPPAGAYTKLSGGGDGRSGHGMEFRGYMRQRLPGVLGNRFLLVSVAELDDGATAIRVDAQVIWLEAHPPEEVMPAAARHLTITSQNHRPIRIADAARVQRIARLLNGADIVQPDLVLCERARVGQAQPRLTFRARRRGQPLAVVRVHPSGCASADVQIAGRKMPALDLRFDPGARLLKTLDKLGAF